MVDNRPVNYVRIDPVRFVAEPFARPGDGASRHDLPHYLLKTSLFGAFTFLPQSEGIARAISFTLLLILVYLLVSMVGDRKFMGARFLPVFFSLAALAAALVFVRYRLPTSANSDYRFIVPATISLTILYVASIDGHFAAERRVIAWIGIGLMGAFLGLSSLFWLLAV